jgi:2-isopropylmalate synthase
LFEEDLETIVNKAVTKVPERFSLKGLHVESGLSERPSAKVELLMNGELASQTGETKSLLRAYIVKAITGGTDAQGEVSVRVEENGEVVTGHGSDTDIIIASAQAYLNALNKLADLVERNARAEQKIGLC